MARYFDLLDGLGLVEPGTALAALPQAMPADRGLSVLLEGFPPPGEQRRRFFAACPWLRVAERLAPVSYTHLDVYKRQRRSIPTSARNLSV